MDFGDCQGDGGQGGVDERTAAGGKTRAVVAGAAECGGSPGRGGKDGGRVSLSIVAVRGACYPTTGRRAAGWGGGGELFSGAEDDPVVREDGQMFGEDARDAIRRSGAEEVGLAMSEAARALESRNGKRGCEVETGVGARNGTSAASR